MAKNGSKRSKKAKAQDAALNLDGFEQVPEDQGLTLDALSGSLANLMGEGSDPYAVEEALDADDLESDPSAAADVADQTESGADSAELDEATKSPARTKRKPLAAEIIRHPPSEDGCPVTPQSILEAMLFVGHPSDEPLTSRQVASLMRGVRAAEIDQFVVELNETYEEHACPYFIESVEAGYRLSLRASADPIREMFYGKVREAKLSQDAVDVLAIVAYHQPLDKPTINELRREPSGRLINQLVRRELLSVERIDAAEDQPRQTLYQTTDRFLELFGLTSLDDLPRNQDFDRR